MKTCEIRTVSAVFSVRFSSNPLSFASFVYIQTDCLHIKPDTARISCGEEQETAENDRRTTACSDPPEIADDFQPFLLEAGLLMPLAMNPIPPQRFPEQIQSLLPINAEKLREISAIGQLIDEDIALTGNLKRKATDSQLELSKKKRKVAPEAANTAEKREIPQEKEANCRGSDVFTWNNCEKGRETAKNSSSAANPPEKQSESSKQKAKSSVGRSLLEQLIETKRKDKEKADTLAKETAKKRLEARKATVNHKERQTGEQLYEDIGLIRKL